MISWSDVVAVEPAAATVPLGSQTAILTDVYSQLPAQRWGTKLDLGAKYLAAHEAVCYVRGGGLGPAGAVTSEKLGPAARTYATPRLSPRGFYTDLYTTLWGLKFYRLAKGVGALAGVPNTTNTPLNIPPDDFSDPWGGRFGSGV